MSDEASENRRDDPLPDASIPDEVVLEEGSGYDDGGVGLELDARQATELRQIFLATLPDYLEPIRQMAEQLTSDPGHEGDTLVTLTKTLSSVAEAAERVGIDDVHQTLALLREDVLLWGEGGESPEALRARFGAALDELGALVRGASGATATAPRGESIVSALEGVEGVAPWLLQKLLAAGVTSVDKILGAAPGEVAAVSGLDPEAVESIVQALRARAAAGEPSVLAPEPPSDEPTELGALLEQQVESELALEEARSRLLRARLRVRELEWALAAVQRQRAEVGHALREVKQDTVEAQTELARVHARRNGVERDAAAIRARLEGVASRLASLEEAQRSTAAYDSELARDLMTLARRVDGVLRDLWPAPRGGAGRSTQPD